MTPEYVRDRLDYDPETGEFVWKWRDDVPRAWNTKYASKVAGTFDSKGYRSIKIDGRPHKAHRLAWLIATGEWPDEQIDHINGVRDDNRLANLRSVSRTENMRNTATPSRNTSGVLGVCRHKRSDKWQAQMQVDGRMIHLGLFTDISDAIAARAAADVARGFHPNHGRKTP